MVDSPKNIWATFEPHETGKGHPITYATATPTKGVKYIRADLATLSDAVAEREPYAYEFGRSNGDYTFSVYIERSLPPKTHPDWPVTPLYTSPPTSELEALRKRVAELEKALEHDQWSIIDRAIERYTNGEISDLHALGLITTGFLKLDAERQAARRVREGGKVDG